MKHFLRHFFVPRESNNHRSRILHHDSLLIIITILFAGFIVIQGMKNEYPQVLGDATSITTAQLLEYTNLERGANGLPPLKMNTDLTNAAQMKANDMFKNDYWAHVSPNGTTPWVWIRDSGYNYLYAGENLARGFNSTSDVVTAWMNSPEHRANLLSPNYTDIGFAVEDGTLTGTETTLVVQEFGSPYNAEGVVAASNSPSPTPIPASAIVAAVLPPASGSGQVIGKVKVEPLAVSSGTTPQDSSPFDASTLKRNISFAMIGFFLLILALDAIVMERKKIARIFSHNVDHILFLLFILLAGIIIGRGGFVL